MNRNAILSAAVIGTVVLAASRAQQREISGHARVHDGDTIIIDGVHVRLRGIDAEELSMTNGPKSRAVMSAMPSSPAGRTAVAATTGWWQRASCLTARTSVVS